MPRPTVTELNEARRRSGNLGGRPRNPTVAEARAVKLEELVPKALRVLEANLDAENEHVRQRAADSVLDRAWGKAVQAIRQEVEVPDSPFESMTPEEQEAAIAAVRRKIARIESMTLQQGSGPRCCGHPEQGLGARRVRRQPLRWRTRRRNEIRGVDADVAGDLATRVAIAMRGGGRVDG